MFLANKNFLASENPSKLIAFLITPNKEQLIYVSSAWNKIY